MANRSVGLKHRVVHDEMGLVAVGDVQRKARSSLKDPYSDSSPDPWDHDGAVCSRGSSQFYRR